MKKLKLYMLLGLGFILMNSCSDELSDLNVNPDKSPNANPEEVFSSAIGYMAWVLDGQCSEDSFMWAQYWTWGPGVALNNIEKYIGEAADYNNRWIRTYANALTDLKFVANSDAKALAGAAKVLTAYIYQGLVDHYGDVPFTEALAGADEGIFSPKFDDDAAIYAALVPMIDEGIADLGSGGSIGSEDLIYGGDISSWMKFANSLKLRIMMRQADVAGTDLSANVKALIDSGTFIESAGDNAEVAFDGIAGDENPMYADMEAGVKNFFIGSNTSMDYLANLNDPRLEAFYAPAANTGTLIGIAQGSIDDEPFTASVGDYSQMTDVCYGAANSVVLMSAWEVWFLRAEAANRYGTSDNESSAFSSAVTSNFDYVGALGSAGYITSLDFDSKSDADRLDQIGIQKWISMNGTQEDEGWIESRRFDVIPNTIFVKSAVGVLPDGVYPSIWFYSSNEVSLNPNTPAQHAITDKVFWDVN